MNRRFCFALDLKGDPALITEYRKYHEKIRRSGDLPARHAHVHDHGSNPELFVRKESQGRRAQSQGASLRAARVEIPATLREAKLGEKWLRMERIFKLEA